MSIALLLLVFAGIFPEDEVVAEVGRGLLEKARPRVQSLEVAAFLIREPDGTWRVLVWPPTFRYREQRFHGTIPEGTVAIIHTHPSDAPYASLGDLMTARKLKMPVVAVSRRGIYVIGPNGKQHAIRSERLRDRKK